MTELLDYEPPDGVEVLVQWLKTLEWNGQIVECRDTRPINAPLPFILVRRVGGPDDGWTDHGRYTVQCFAAKDSDALALARTVHRRVRLLAGKFVGQEKVTTSSGDVYADNVVTREGPRPLDVLDNGGGIFRYTMMYDIPFRYGSV